MSDGGVGAIPRRIAFINEKGGSGKTTLVANLAAYLATQRGRRVLAIDMDPQGQLGKVLGLEVRRPRRSAIELLLDEVLDNAGASPEQASPSGQIDAQSSREDHPSQSSLDARLPLVSTRMENLDVIVSNKSLALFPAWTGRGESGDDPTLRLVASLDRAPELEDYDFVLFDAPPSFGPLTLNILRACNEVVVPVPLTFLALDGCAELMRTLSLVRNRYHHSDLRLSMVIPTFYRRTRMAAEILQKLESRFPKEISNTVVGYNVKVDEAQSRGLSVFEYAPRDRGALAMAALAEELEVRARPPARANESATVGEAQ